MDSSSNPKPPRILFLSVLGPPHAHLARSLIQAGHVTHLLRVVEEPDPARPSLWRRVLAHPWTSVSSKMREIILNPYLASIDESVRKALPCPSTYAEHEYGVPTHNVPTWQLNSATMEAWMRALDPQLIIVSGAPMLQRRIYERATHETINVHWGIAPRYRGGHTLFWALYHRDRKGIGYTVHRVARGSDTGDIYGQRVVPVSSRADEGDCWVACALDASDWIPTLIRDLRIGNRRATPQSSAGTLYRYRDRTLLKQIYFQLIVRRRPWKNGNELPG